MARGQSSKGKREGGAPDWLNPEQVNTGGGGGAAAREEKPRRRRRDEDDEDLDDDKSKKKGIRWGPFVLLIMMTAPALLPTMLDLFAKLEHMGYLKMPSNPFVENKYRPCLQEFYADWAPDKLGDMDKTLEKFEGKEKSLFAKLQRKYNKKVNIAKCS
mmetsp:Transcript_27828/g.47581  ORF Transcript_27828/g.47581 Transcript_27828/m.47581 type:complete len:158 (-) Transcript_27828:313-786(-)